MPTVIDHAGPPPGAAAVKAAGHAGAVRYIAPDRTRGSLPGKPINRQEVDDYRAAALDLAVVWQYGGNDGRAPHDVTRGRDGGFADARAAQAHLDAIGLPCHPVFFAVDFNIQLHQWNETAIHYFRAVNDVLGRHRTGIYGHSRVCAWAVQDQVVATTTGGKHLCWQTAAWSAGELAPEACLYQRAGNVLVGRTQVDVNDVLTDDWGQRPRAGLPAAPAPAPVPVTPPIQRRPGWSGDPVWLAGALRAFGVDVTEEPGWLDRGQGDFRTVWGVVAHHTAGNTTPTWLIRDGRPDLPGLLSQVHLLRDGRAVVCGVGIAWHAGAGSYPGLPTNAGNWHTIGIEANSDGVSPWPAEMLDAYVRCCAAICWVLGVSSLRTIGHREYSSQGKWDPGGIDLPQFRARVQAYIDHPPFMPTHEEISMSDFWDEQIESLVDRSKTFPRREFLRLTGYHATLGTSSPSRRWRSCGWSGRTSSSSPT